MTDVQAVAKFFPDPWDRLDPDELMEDVEVEAFRLSQVQNPELNCWKKLKALRWLYLWGNAVSEQELDKLNHELNSAYDAKQMMEALNEDGFRDENGEPFGNVDAFLRAVELSAAGTREFYSIKKDKLETQPDLLRPAVDELMRAHPPNDKSNFRLMEEAAEIGRTRGVEAMQAYIQETNQKLTDGRYLEQQGDGPLFVMRK
jgi:hypothetical protein